MKGGAQPRYRDPVVLSLDSTRRGLIPGQLEQLTTARDIKRLDSARVVVAAAAPTSFDAALEAWGAMRLKRRRGKAISTELVTLALTVYFSNAGRPADDRHAALLKHATSISGLSLPTVRKFVDYFLENHEILIEDVALRGRGSYAGYMLPVGIKEDVVEWVCDELNHDAGPQWVTRMGLQQHIRETYDNVMARKRICKLAGVWDLDWGAIKKTPAGKCSPECMLCGRSMSYRWLGES